jgi:hypothetical protein
MRDWFATLRKPRATGATGATTGLNPCDTSLSDSPGGVAQTGNRWATEATNPSAEDSKPCSVAQVAHGLPNESSDRERAEVEGNSGSQSPVAQVAQVAQQNGRGQRGDRPDPWDAEDWQVFFDERAGIAEYNGGVSRAEAEARAFKWCITEMMEQYSEPSLPDQCAWCGEPDITGTSVVPFGTQSHGHTWLHSGCVRRPDHQVSN